MTRIKIAIAIFASLMAGASGGVAASIHFGGRLLGEIANTDQAAKATVALSTLEALKGGDAEKAIGIQELVVDGALIALADAHEQGGVLGAAEKQALQKAAAYRRQHPGSSEPTQAAVAQALRVAESAAP